MSESNAHRRSFNPSSMTISARVWTTMTSPSASLSSRTISCVPVASARKRDGRNLFCIFVASPVVTSSSDCKEFLALVGPMIRKRLSLNVAFTLRSRGAQITISSTDFRTIPRTAYAGYEIGVQNNEWVRIWIYLMTGQQIDRKKVSSHVKVTKSLCCRGNDFFHECRSCIISQLLNHVQECLHELAQWTSPETCQLTFTPWAVSMVDKSIEQLIEKFTYVLDNLAAASGKTGHERGVADQVTKKTVQEIQIHTSRLIKRVDQISVKPPAQSEHQDVEGGWNKDEIRIALSDRLTRLQKVAETLTIEQPSQRFVSTYYDLSPPTVCQIVRALSPGLDHLLGVGADPRNRIVIQRVVNTRTGGEIGWDCNGGENPLMTQQGSWMNAKADKRCSPHLRLEFDNFEALQGFTECTSKQMQKSVTRIELEYDPFDRNLTSDAVVQIVNTKFQTLRSFCTSVLPVRHLAADPRVWGRHSDVLKEGNQGWWREREIAYFNALEKIIAHVCLMFRWEADADWFAQNYSESGKWISSGYKEGDEGFGEWIFEKGS